MREYTVVVGPYRNTEFNHGYDIKAKNRSEAKTFAKLKAKCDNPVVRDIWRID